MARQGMRQDQVFWQIVKDLRWKLDDGTSGIVPAHEPEFGHGATPRRRFRVRMRPELGTHLVAFLLGGLSVALLVLAVT